MLGYDTCTHSRQSHLCRLGLLRSVLGPRCDSATNTTLQLVSSYFCFDTVRLTKSNAPLTKWYFTPGQSCARPPRTMTTECCCTLCPRLPLALVQHSIISIRTFTRNIRRNDLSSAQPDPRNLPLSGVGFLRLRCAHFQAYTLQLRPISQLSRSQFSRLLRYPSLPQDLYQCAFVGAR